MDKTDTSHGVIKRGRWRGAKGYMERSAKNLMICVRLDHETMGIVRDMSQREDVPAAEVIRRLIARGLMT